MKVYCVSYDLTKPDRNYEELYEKLKAYGTYSHALESTWFIEAEDGAAEVRDNLKEVLDTDDKLLVIEVIANHWASYNLRTKTNEWLKH